MPTGYTVDLCKEDQSFEEFALNCARAFGATITMRDEPLSAKIPEFEPSDFYKKELAEAKDELVKIQTASLTWCEHQAEEEFNTELKRNKEAIKKANDTRKRLLSMINKVQNWTPPSKDHEELQRFMLDQLGKTIDFDGSDRIWRDNIRNLELLCGGMWRKKKGQELHEKIDRYTKEHQKELERTKNRNKWVKQLRESLNER